MLEGFSHPLQPTSPLALENGMSTLDWDGLLDYSTPVLPQQIDPWPLNDQTSGEAELLATSLALETAGGSVLGLPNTLRETVPSPQLGARTVASGPSIPFIKHTWHICASADT